MRSIEASDDIIDALYGIGDNNKDVTEGSHSNSDISSEGERMLAHHYHMQGGDEEAGRADAPAESSEQSQLPQESMNWRLKNLVPRGPRLRTRKSLRRLCGP